VRLAQRQVVVQGNGLEYGAELVIAIAPLADDVQAQIDLREGT
jgi:hypothetical protein